MWSQEKVVKMSIRSILKNVFQPKRRPQPEPECFQSAFFDNERDLYRAEYPEFDEQSWRVFMEITGSFGGREPDPRFFWKPKIDENGFEWVREVTETPPRNADSGNPGDKPIPSTRRLNLRRLHRTSESVPGHRRLTAVARQLFSSVLP